MDCVAYMGVESLGSDYYQQFTRDKTEVEVSIRPSIKPFSFWTNSCICASNEFEYTKYVNFKKSLWDLLFSDEEMPEPYVGAVDDYAGVLGKLLPAGVEIDIEKELDAING